MSTIDTQQLCTQVNYICECARIDCCVSMTHALRGMQLITNRTSKLRYIFCFKKTPTREFQTAINGRFRGRILKPNTFLDSAKLGDSNDVLHQSKNQFLLKTVKLSSSFSHGRNGVLAVFEESFSRKYTSQVQESIPIERTQIQCKIIAILAIRATTFDIDFLRVISKQ